MKNILLTAGLLLICSLSFAQFKISGKINGGTLPDSVYVNIPFVYGYYTENTLGIAVDKSGHFAQTIAVKNKRFGSININRKMFTILLTPGKSLELTVNGADTLVTRFGGTAAAENKLLYPMGFEDQPFFTADTVYAHLTLPQIKEQVINKWFAMRNNKLKQVEASSLPAFDKRLIGQEINANAISHLNDYARGFLATGRPQIFELVEEIYKGVPLHASVMPAGPQYYAFANSYIGYLETMAIKDLPNGALNDPKTFIKYFDITIGQGDSIIKKGGKQYLNWTLAHKQFSRDEAEQWIAQAIEAKYLTKDLNQAKPLFEDMQKYYPHSSYLPGFKLKMQKLEQALARNMANKEIIIADRYEKITSIYDVVKTLKGKVVYLDIWGTWCGPCKHELKFNPQLKQYFKGKDVAYIYLDMDDDTKDSQWRDFIRINGMTGIHLRKSGKAIQAFWDELKPGGGTRYYPTYFIFDRDGKLVQADAKRPSERAELYKQIEQYL